MKLKVIITLSLIFYFNVTKSQEMEDLNINSFNPSDTNYQDLDPLYHLLKNEKYIFLGEPSHGDGSAFIMKTRLVKWLYKELGFRIIAFESDYFAMDEAWRDINTNKFENVDLTDNIYPIWSQSNECSELFSFIKVKSETQQKLVISGFDCRHILDFSRNRLATFLNSQIESILPNYSKSEDYKFFTSKVNKLTKTEYVESSTENEKVRFLSIADTINSLLNLKKELTLNDSYLINLIQSVKSFAINAWSFNHKNGEVYFKDNRNPNGNIRDEQMAKNIINLINRNPDKKIIFWGANLHFASDLKSAELTNTNDINYKMRVTTVDYLKNYTSIDPYVIAITAYKGEIGDPWSKKAKLEPANDGSYEHRMQLSFDIAFTNLKSKDYLNKTFLARPFGYKPMNLKWSNHLDAIIFIKDMKPSTLIQND